MLVIISNNVTWRCCDQGHTFSPFLPLFRFSRCFCNGSYGVPSLENDLFFVAKNSKREVVPRPPEQVRLPALSTSASAAALTGQQSLTEVELHRAASQAELRCRAKRTNFWSEAIASRSSKEAKPKTGLVSAAWFWGMFCFNQEIFVYVSMI